MFTVKKVPLIANSEEYGATDSYGIYRTDTKAYLGTVGHRYVPTQNQKLHDLVAEAATLSGVENPDIRYIELKGGRRVAFQFELPDWSIGGDIVKRHMSTLNTHDGSSSIGMGLIGVRVVCTNTWLQGYKECKKIRHTSSQDYNLKIMMDEIAEKIENDKEMFKFFTRLKNNPYSSLDHSKFIKGLIGYDIEDLEKEEANTTRKENKFYAIHDAIDEELVSAGRNEWGLFNGITNYTNHVLAAKKDDPKDYLYFGGGAELNNKAISMFAEN